MNIILSIKPKWAELIYSGKKTIEWRKSWPKYEKFEFIHVGKVFLYETAPVKMITGFFELNGCRELIIREESFEYRYKDIHPDAKEIIAAGCVPLEDLKKYQGKNFSLFGWRIKNPTKFCNHRLRQKAPPGRLQGLDRLGHGAAVLRHGGGHPGRRGQGGGPAPGAQVL